MKKIILIVSSALVLGAFNYGIYKKETIKANGETVFLLLGTADPRSLMQGDYMRLRYRIEDQRIPDGTPLSGYIVITLDENKVGTFASFYNGEQLASRQKLMHYENSYSRLNIKPDNFMFQEGHGDAYAQARYGVFKFDGARDYILTGLADDKFQIIQPTDSAPGTAAPAP